MLVHNLKLSELITARSYGGDCTIHLHDSSPSKELLFSADADDEEMLILTTGQCIFCHFGDDNEISDGCDAYIDYTQYDMTGREIDGGQIDIVRADYPKIQDAAEMLMGDIFPEIPKYLCVAAVDEDRLFTFLNKGVDICR